MSNQIVPTNNMQDFISFMANREKRDMTSAPRPASVKLNGNTGHYSMNVWNKDEKKYDEKELGTSLTGTVLDVCYFVKSKYVPDAREYWRTREFSSMKDEVQLLHINNDAKDGEKTKVVSAFHSYQDFKLQNTTVNKMTGKETYDFDFYVSLYVYLHEIDQVVNVQMKGSSRGAWFDFMKCYAGSTGAQALVQVKVGFGVMEELSPLKDKAGNEQTYFRMAFMTIGLNSDGVLMKVATVTQSLFQWKAAWEAQNGPPSDETVKATALPIQQTGVVYSPILQEKVSEMDKINLDEIPFG